MDGNVKKYIDAAKGRLPKEIVSARTYGHIYNTASFLSELEASEYIMETRLDSDDAQIDFSLRVLESERPCMMRGLGNERFADFERDSAWESVKGFVKSWEPGVSDIWLEMDYEECEKDIPQPCFFFNATELKKGNEVDFEGLFSRLGRLMRTERLDAIRDNAIGAISALADETGLFQIGVMLSRHADRARIFTAEMTRHEAMEYLERAGWNGSFEKLVKIFETIDYHSDGRYILDFDIAPGGMSEKLGVNFGLKGKKSLEGFLERLEANGLCKDSKKEGVTGWGGSTGCFLGKDYGYTAIINDISHFKFSCSHNEDIRAKAYLRIYGIYLKELCRGGQNGKMDKEDQEKELKKEKIKEAGKETAVEYRSIQELFKEIGRRSAVDMEFRQLCLADSIAAIEEVAGTEEAVQYQVVFIEHGNEIQGSGCAYVLPPYIKKSWIFG